MSLWRTRTEHGTGTMPRHAAAVTDVGEVLGYACSVIGRIPVITVTYSPGEHLQRFLDSTARATSSPTTVFMADNGSVDGSVEQAVERADTELLVMPGNLGYGTAINRAVAEVIARGEEFDPEFLVISNPDVEFEPGAIDELIAAAARWPRAGSLGPKVIDTDGTVYPSARQIPRLATGIGHAVLSQVWKSNPWTQSYLDDTEMGRERTAGWLSGSCLLLRRSAFAEIGGFDERYFMYMEDVDLGDRLGRAGWLNVYVPSARILHDKGHAAGEIPHLMLPAHHRSAYQFQADRHPYGYQAPLRWALKAGLALRSRLALRAVRRSNPR